MTWQALFENPYGLPGRHKLVVWHAQNLDDHGYSIYARTKREALAQLGRHDPERFGRLQKVIIQYDDAFDLFERSVSSDGYHSYIPGYVP